MLITTTRFSTALIAAATACFVFPTGALAQTGTPTSTLDLTIHTGSTAAKKTPQGRPRPRGKAPLPSRGFKGRTALRQTPTTPQVLGKLAQTIIEEAKLRLGRDTTSRVLSVVSKGTYLAVVADVGEYYGVLMADKSTGWVPKTSVQMIDYQVAVSDPAAEARPEAGPNSGIPGGLPDDLDERTSALLREAFTYLGVPYVWAGNTRSGLDCSAFVRNVFSTQGVRLPRVSADQARVGAAVNWEELRAGDRLYFDMGNKGRVSHTGIYLGNGYFIHASSNRKCVDVDSLMKPSYYKALVGARRS